jgi:hypothetical protein
VRGTFWKHATCSSCVVRFMIVLKTRYASANVPSTVVVAKSPMVTPIAWRATGFARRARDHRLREVERPCTATRGRASPAGRYRPVPIPELERTRGRPA